MNLSRRQFSKGLSALAFSGLASSYLGKAYADKTYTNMPVSKGYGNLIPDPKGLLDLPPLFSYEVISELGDAMSDGLHVPDRADGMGCFPLENNKIALIRNHELRPDHLSRQPNTIGEHITSNAYDHLPSKVALPGGTSTLVYDLASRTVDRQFLSLCGTIRNCSGGVTPWGSWLSCEESVDRAGGKLQKDHGYVFEIPAKAKGLVEPVPLKAMGRFNHEAASVDPTTGIVYMTEDRDDGLFYRFVPNEYGQLRKGGVLQVLVLTERAQFDSRNWSEEAMKLGNWLDAQWITLDNPESPEDDLRKRGFEAGAALFARGEGVHWADNELYFCCTSGGTEKLGQIMRYRPRASYTGNRINQTGQLQLFVESKDPSLYNFGDNLTVTPQGHLLVCEDQYTSTVNNHLRGVTPRGEVYDFASLNAQTELAGACFSPDGSTLFVNAYSPSKTFAIRGPWSNFI